MLPANADSACCAEALERALPTIKRLVATASRGSRPPDHDAEELLGEVLVKLVANDYAVLRKFRGDSQLATFLNTFVRRVLFDMRRHAWGKWRPSKRACTLGSAAEVLDRLVRRDRLPVGEALRVLMQTDRRIGYSEALQLYAAIRPRPPLRRVTLDEVPAFETSVRGDDPIEADLVSRRGREVRWIMTRVLGHLSPNERDLVRLRYYEHRSVAEIATLLGVEPKRLYRRFEQVAHRLRQALERERVSIDDVRMLVGQKTVDLSVEALRCRSSGANPTAVMRRRLAGSFVCTRGGGGPRSARPSPSIPIDVRRTA